MIHGSLLYSYKKEFLILSPLGGSTRNRLKVWERGRENGSFPVEEGLGNREVSQEQIPFATGEGG